MYMLATCKQLTETGAIKTHIHKEKHEMTKIINWQNTTRLCGQSSINIQLVMVQYA